jgi:hypothetical protein
MQVKMAVVTRAVRIMAMMSTVTETVLSLAPIGDACLGPAFIAKFGWLVVIVVVTIAAAVAAAVVVVCKMTTEQNHRNGVGCIL